MMQKKRILIELNNKVVSLEYFSSEIHKKGSFLLSKKYRKQNLTYRPYQVLLSIIEAYLDSLHSIIDLITKIDKSLNKNFYKEIYNEDWFKIKSDLRNIFHHNQSPLLSIEQNLFSFKFNKLPKQPRYFKTSMKKGAANNKYYEVHLNIAEGALVDPIKKFLNMWAKKHIEQLDENTELDVIEGFYPDRRIKSKQLKLSEFKKRL